MITDVSDKQLDTNALRQSGCVYDFCLLTCYDTTLRSEGTWLSRAASGRKANAISVAERDTQQHNANGILSILEARADLGNCTCQSPLFNFSALRL
eukprot:5104086-Amphidinium_carterae.1